MALAKCKHFIYFGNVHKNDILLTNKSPITLVFKAHYAKKKVSATATLAKKGIAQPTQQRKYLDVELDTKILTTRLVGGNILKEGEDPVLGEDNDYPDWLWTLKTDRTPLKLEDLEYDTDEYWRYMVVKDKLRRRTMQKKNHKYRIFKSRFTNEPYVMEY